MDENKSIAIVFKDRPDGKIEVMFSLGYKIELKHIECALVSMTDMAKKFNKKSNSNVDIISIKEIN